MAVAKKGNLVKWDEEMAKYATAAAAVETAGGQFISIRGAQMSFNGNDIPGNKLEVVALASAFENQYYGNKKFDPDNPSSPICYAFGDKVKGMAPHDAAPQKQNATCEGCKRNDFGTADQGKGKACKNVKRLALIMAEGLDDPKAIEEASVAYLKVPVTSVKAWGGYVKTVAETTKRPPFAVVTEIKVIPDKKTQLKVQFRLVEKIATAASFEALLKRHQDATKTIGFAYPELGDNDDRPAKKASNGKKKKYTR